MTEFIAENVNCKRWSHYRETPRRYLAPEDLSAGMFIGISICNYHYTGYSDDSSPDVYTAPEILKVKGGKLVKSNIWGDKEYRYTLEAPDGRTFDLICRQRKTRDSSVANSPSRSLVFESGRFVETLWSIEEPLVLWIESDLRTQRQLKLFKLTRYPNALAVQQAITQLNEYRQQQIELAEEAARVRARQQAEAERRRQEQEHLNRQAAANLEDYWRKG